MQFFLELTDRIKNHYRLQNDKKTWRRIIMNEPLRDSDFLSSEIYEFFKLQEIDSEIELDRKVWELNSTSGQVGQDNGLEYKILVKRYFYPLVPSFEQLISVIKQGDDRLHNSLILNVFGFFELRNFDTINISIEDPTIVFRHETFSIGNDYVGSNASKDDLLMQNIYSTAIENWLDHLKTGRTNFYADFHTIKKIDYLLEELDKFKANFIFNEE